MSAKRDLAGDGRKGRVLRSMYGLLGWENEQIEMRIYKQ